MLNLLRKDLKLWFAGKKIWIVMTGVLIMIVISTSLHAKEVVSNESYVTIGVCDLDDSQYSRLLLTYINESELLTKFATIIQGTPSELADRFDAGELTMYLVIPDQFAENMIHIENMPIQVTLSTKEKTKAIILKDMLTAYGQYISAVELHCVTLYDAMLQAGMPEKLCESENVAISYQLVFTALGKSDLFSVKEENSVKSVPFIVYYGYQILFFIICLSALLAGMELLKEQRIHMLSRLLTTMTKSGEIIFAKFLSNAILAVVFLGIAVFCIAPGTDHAYTGVILFAYLTFLIMTAFFLFLSTCFNTTSGYLLCSNILILFAAVIGGGVLPVRFLPDVFAAIAKVTPNGYFLSRILSLYQEKVWPEKSEVVIMIALTAILLCLTSLRCKSQKGGSSDEI